MSIRSEVVDLTKVILSTVPNGSTIRVTRISGAPRVQRRVQGAARSEALIEEARELRTSSGIPFWHALFLVGETSASGVPTPILQSALYHQDPADGEIIPIIVNSATPETLADLTRGLEGRDSLALLSHVTSPVGEERFIPMLDFTSKSSRPGSAATVRSAVEALETRGTLFSSARSYHFYGAKLVSKEEQLNFWARALLLTPIVDERWIAHQIRAQVGALRISANEKGVVPRVLAQLPHAEKIEG